MTKAKTRFCQQKGGYQPRKVKICIELVGPSGNLISLPRKSESFKENYRQIRAHEDRWDISVRMFRCREAGPPSIGLSRGLQDKKWNNVTDSKGVCRDLTNRKNSPEKESRKGIRSNLVVLACVDSEELPRIIEMVSHVNHQPYSAIITLCRLKNCSHSPSVT